MRMFRYLYWKTRQKSFFAVQSWLNVLVFTGHMRWWMCMRKSSRPSLCRWRWREREKTRRRSQTSLWHSMCRHYLDFTARNPHRKHAYESHTSSTLIFSYLFKRTKSMVCFSSECMKRCISWMQYTVALDKSICQMHKCEYMCEPALNMNFIYFYLSYSHFSTSIQTFYLLLPRQH